MADSNSTPPCSFGDGFSYFNPFTWFRSTWEYTPEKPAYPTAALKTEERKVEFRSLPPEMQEDIRRAVPGYRPPDGEFITERTYTAYQAFDAYEGKLLGRDRKYPDAGQMIRPASPRWENMETRVEWEFPDLQINLSQSEKNKSVLDRIVLPRPPDNDFKCFRGDGTSLPDPPPQTQPVDLSAAARRLNALRSPLCIQDANTLEQIEDILASERRFLENARQRTEGGGQLAASDIERLKGLQCRLDRASAVPKNRAVQDMCLQDQLDRFDSALRGEAELRDDIATFLQRLGQKASCIPSSSNSP